MSLSVIGLIKGIGATITDADDAFLRIVGYTRAEFERGEMNWREMAPTEWRDLDAAGMKQAFAGEGGGFALPYRKEVSRKDGSRAHVLLCCAFSADAPPGAWMGYAVDLSSTVAAPSTEPPDARAHSLSTEPSALHTRLIAELVRERTKLLSIFDGTPSLIWAVDCDLRLMIANEAFHRGTSPVVGPRLAVGDPVLDDRFPEAMRAPWEAWYRRALAGEQFVTHSSNEIGGEALYWDHAFAPIRDNTGQVIGASIVSQDVSSRLLAEQRLARSERALTEAQRIAGVGSWEWDPATNRTDWSDEMFRIYDRDPALGAPTYEELAPYHRAEDLEILGRMVAQALETGEPYELDTSFVRRDGSRTWVTGRGEPVRAANGAIVGLRGATLDITRRKETELALKRSERDVRQSQRMARVGSWDWDNRTDNVTMSPVLRELLALPADGPPPAFEEHERFYTPESWQRLLAVVGDAATNGVPYTLDLEFAPGLPARYIVALGEPVRDEAGAIVGLQGVTVDVTDRRLAEEEKRRLERLLIQSQKMDAVGQLAGGIAHDFNNLLTALMLQVNTLHEDPSLSNPVTAVLRDVEAQIDRAATLTRQLLMFSRRQAMDLRAMELNSLIEAFLPLLRRLIGEHVTVRFEASSDRMTLRGDPGMIEQVIMNLVVNARDAMPHGGTITVRTRLVTVSDEAAHRRPEARPGQFVELEVADTGIGIPAEQSERIFEPFFTTKEAGKGTGLGLATAYGIVAQHGGWIEFDSEVGVGTMFCVRLPFAAQESTPSETSCAAETTRQSVTEHVLLVEDEPSLRRLLVRSLERAGYTVEAAANGPEAVQLWDANPERFQIVVSDMVLPGGASGFDLLQRFVKDNPAVRRLLMSGYSAEIVNGTLPGSASIRMLSKPFGGSEFARVVREVLDARS